MFLAAVFCKSIDLRRLPEDVSNQSINQVVEAISNTELQRWVIDKIRSLKDNVQ